ncbi:hypothetical protein BDZ94DRAFT_1252967 [Collybia nuda]|uniref:N-acetyltransferase domain-containing protein n=1 Tax=Collybia nuda TaxID=64659 RepID=A0A9P5YBJ8_9AGAR|nr:hypothetical protein BDZ94DRAFT_1252967 [Collybia nuda]
MEYEKGATKGAFSIKSSHTEQAQSSIPAETTLDVVCRPVAAEQTLPLRHSVLWPDKPISHVLLPEDTKGLHLGAFVASRDHPVAVISLFIKPLPDPIYFQSSQGGAGLQVRFRKFACDTTFQGRGIGSKLLQYGLSAARTELDGTMVWCDARVTSRHWYTKRGLVPLGEIFLKGSVEYIRMYIDVGVSVPVKRDPYMQHENDFQ